MRDRKKKSAAFAVMSCALLLVISEIGARALLWSPHNPVDTGTPRQGFSAKALGDWQPGQDAVWIDRRTHPFYVHINKQGFRNIDDVDPGSYRVVTLGDSQTFGLFASSYDVWTRVSEVLLNKTSDRKVQVLNNGLPGSTIVDHEAYLADKGKRLHPNLVLLVVNENDVADLRQMLTTIGPTREDMRRHAEDAERQLYPIRQFLNDHFALYAAARSARDTLQRTVAKREFERTIARTEDSPRPAADPAAAQPTDVAALSRSYRDFFRRAVASARGVSARIAVVYLPGPESLTRADQPTVTGTLARDLASELSLPFLDLTPSLASFDPATIFFISPIAGDTGYPSDGHLSRFGHWIVGQTVASFLRNLIADAGPSR